MIYFSNRADVIATLDKIKKKSYAPSTLISILKLLNQSKAKEIKIYLHDTKTSN